MRQVLFLMHELAIVMSNKLMGIKLTLYGKYCDLILFLVKSSLQSIFGMLFVKFSSNRSSL